MTLRGKRGTGTSCANHPAGRSDKRRLPPFSQPILLATLGAGSLALLLLEQRTWSLVLNTLFLSGSTCAISVPLGTVLGWLLVRTDLPLRRVGLVLLGVMLFVPLYLQAAAWQAGFGLQGWLTLIFRVPPLLDSWTGAIWVHTAAAIPWVVLITGTGFWLVEPELEEQALLDASPLEVFARVTLPAASGAVGVASIWVLIVTAGEMTVTDLFVVRTYAEEIYTRMAVGLGPDDVSLGLLSGVILVAWLTAGGLVLSARLAPANRPLSTARRPVFRLRRLRLPAVLAVAAVLLLLVGVPLANLVYKAGVVVTQTDAGRLRSWSLVKTAAIVGTSPIRYGREFGWSLGIGALSATAAATGGIVLAWFANAGRLRAAFVMVVTAVLLAVPGPMIGMAVIWLLNRPDCPALWLAYDQSILAPCLALSLRALPPVVLIAWHAFRSVPGELLDAATLDGAGPLVRLRRIVLPSVLPSIMVAWLVALAITLGDLAASVLVVPPGVTTLSVRIFGLLHYGVEDQVAGISLALVAMFTLMAAMIAGVSRRWSDLCGAARR